MTADDGGRTIGPGLFVGRNAELDELRAVVDGVAAGYGRAVVVSGEAGIGKSALVEAMAARARSAGMSVQWARCFELGSAPAYWPWTQLLRGILAADVTRDLDDAARYAIAVLAPDLAAIAVVPARSESSELDRDENRFRLFDSVVRLLDAASRERPQCLVLEDSHAADAASLQLLRFVLANTGQHSTYVFVTTHRDDEVSAKAMAAIADLGSSVSRVSLHGLAVDEVAGVVAAVTGETPPRNVAAALHDATGGNPLFVKALTRELVRTGQLASFGGGSAVRVPGNIRAVLDARFSVLAPHVAEQLAVLAAAGRDVDSALAHGVLGDDYDVAVSTGIAASILERNNAGGLRFAHSLVQAALLDRLDVANRQAIEGRVATALEALHERDLVPHLPALSHHFALAGPAAAPKAFTYSRAAGDEARRVGAVADAAGHYTRALEVATLAGVGGPERAAVLARRGHARIRAGDLDGGQADCREAWEMARRAGDVTVMGEAALAYATLTVGGVIDHEAIRLMSGALANIGTVDRGVRARLRARLAVEVSFSAAAQTRESLAREAVAEARETGDPFVIFSTLRFAEGAIATPGNVRTCRDWMSEALVAAEAMGDLAAKADAHALRSAYHLTLGDAEAYGADVAALGQLAGIVPTPGNRWHVTVAAGCRALLDGRFDDAAATIASSLEFASTVPNALVNWHFQEFSLEWDRGDIARFEPIVKSIVEARPEAGPMFRSAIVLMQAAAGRVEEGRANLASVAKEVIAREQPRMFLLSVGWLADAARMIRDAEVAGVLRAALEPHADLHVIGQTGAVASYWGAVRRHLANLSLLVGDRNAAVRHGEEAVVAHARVGSLPFLVRSQHELGLALLERARDGGGHDGVVRARALMAEAHATATRLGMTAFLHSLNDAESATTSSAPVPAELTGGRPRLIREGDYWTLTHGATVVRLRHTKGVQYLAALLRRPGAEVHVLDLTSSRPRGGARLDDAGGDPQLDDQARTAYRERLRELERDIAQADEHADIGRASRLREEWDFLVEELKRATGLGGTARRLGTSPSEAARVAVTKAVRSVIKKIDAAAPELGRHFRATIRTGTYCAYSSEIEPCLAWDVIDR